MSAILITGATGFLGGALSRRLLRDGTPVVALGRDPGRLAALAALGAETHALDLAGAAPVLPRAPISAVVHCAALSSAWGVASAFESANVRGTETALGLAKVVGARRFVHISTPSLYFRFHDQTDVREDAALPRPVNAYAATKRVAEARVQAETGLDRIILRPRGLYGKGDTALLPRLLRAARSGRLPLIHGGAAETDLTHIDDAISAVLAALDAPRHLAQTVFNISGGEPLPVRQIAEAAGAQAGTPIRWRRMPASLVLTAARAFEAAARLDPLGREPRLTTYGAGLFAFTQTLDISAARKYLKWQPARSFSEGLALTFEAEA